MNDDDPTPRRDGRLRPHATDPDRVDAFLPSPSVQSHAANLMPLPGGDLGCVWFGGTQEGMADISIWFSRLPAGADTWTGAHRLSDDPARSEQNPILFPTPDGPLWLIWTAQIAGNQDTAFVRRRTSGDGGRTWGPTTTLFEPESGRGLFVRQPPLVTADGAWLLPVFHCPTTPGRRWVGDDDTSAVLRSTDRGHTWTEHPVPGSRGCVHMNIVPARNGRRLIAFYRSRWADHIWRSESTDDGRHWSAPAPTALPNNNSSIQCTRLRSGALALVFNDRSADATTERRASLYDEIDDPADDAAVSGATPPAATASPPTDSRTAFWGTPRAPLTLGISHDDGHTWTLRDVETGDGYCMTNNSRDRTNRELSYPTVHELDGGAIGIAYTWHRQAIRFVRVAGEGWVRDGGRGVGV